MIERLDRNESNSGLPPKVFGKYYREKYDPLVARPLKNDTKLAWHKEVSFLWDATGKRFKFEDAESTQKALASGKYFDTPSKKNSSTTIEGEFTEVKAVINKKSTKVKAIEAKIEENNKAIEEIKAQGIKVED